jgi:hypothetical protein
MTTKISKEENRLQRLTDEFINMTEDELKEYMLKWYPGGSGPIGAMYAITALCRVVAELKGMDIS